MSSVSYEDAIPRDWCHIVRADGWARWWHLVMEVTMISPETCWTWETRVGLSSFFLQLSLLRPDSFRLLLLVWKRISALLIILFSFVLLVILVYSECPACSQSPVLVLFFVWQPLFLDVSSGQLHPCFPLWWSPCSYSYAKLCWAMPLQC